MDISRPQRARDGAYRASALHVQKAFESTTDPVGKNLHGLPCSDKIDQRRVMGRDWTATLVPDLGEAAEGPRRWFQPGKAVDVSLARELWHPRLVSANVLLDLLRHRPACTLRTRMDVAGDRGSPASIFSARVCIARPRILIAAIILSHVTQGSQWVSPKPNRSRTG